METVQHVNVGQISGDEKRLLEGVVGRQLNSDEQVLIMVYKPGSEPDAGTRRQAMANIHRLQEKVGDSLRERGVSDAEFDEAVEEAVNFVRGRAS